MKLTFPTGVSTFPQPDLIRSTATDLKAVALAVLILAAKCLEQLALSPAAAAAFMTEGAM